VVYTYSQEFDIDTRQPLREPSAPLKEPVFGQGIATIAKNWSYDDPKLETADGYAVLKQLSGKTDSHDVVAYWMIQMNVACAERGVAVYRGTEPMEPRFSAPAGLSSFSEEHINYVVSPIVPSTAKYSLQPLEHIALEVQKYTHITSPIRRLVDIMNQGPLPYWLNRIDYINDQCKQIKRAQMDCDLLAFSMNTEPDIIYEGTIIKQLDYFEYVVELCKYGLRVRLKCDKILEIGSNYMFKIFVFNDENTLCKKVRLCLS
jgi:hypothetical protein